MVNSSKHAPLAAFLLIILCGVVIWVAAFLQPSKPHPASPSSEKKAPIAQAQAVPPPHAETSSSSLPLQRDTGAGGDKISSIIANPNLDFPSAVNRLLELLPGLGEQDQEEAAHHIANLSDENSMGQWCAMLVANQLPPPATNVLFDDLLNRPQEINMPALAAMADQPAHLKNKDSAEILDTLFGSPPQGVTWKEWIKQKTAEAAK